MDDIRYVPPKNIAFQDGMRHKITYTQEEDMAVIEGVCKLGWGKWQEIKLTHGFALRERTAASIKDRARNLKKNDVFQERAYVAGHYV